MRKQLGKVWIKIKTFRPLQAHVFNLNGNCEWKMLKHVKFLPKLCLSQYRQQVYIYIYICRSLFYSDFRINMKVVPPFFSPRYDGPRTLLSPSCCFIRHRLESSQFSEVTRFRGRRHAPQSVRAKPKSN